MTVNPGDDIATLTAALAAGDEIVFNAGVYSIAAPLTWSGIGTASSPISLRAEGEVIIELSAGWTVVHLLDVAYLTVEGITFRSAEGYTEGHYGVYIENADHLTFTGNDVGPVVGTALYAAGTLTALTVTRNELHDTTNGAGAYFGCDDAQCWMEGSEVSGNWIHDIGGEYNYGLYVAMGGQDNLVADNVIYNNLYRGLSVHSTEYGPYNEVRGNAIWSVGSIGLYVRGASRVWNNIVFDVDGVGMQLTKNDHDILDDVVVTHNTVAQTTGYGVVIESWSGRTGNAFANNAIANINGYGLKVADGGLDDAVLFRNNVVSGLVEGVDLTSAGGGVLPGGGDGDFVDPALWDFYPSPNSTLLAAGDPDGFVPTVDFNGVARDGSAPDVGAYEYDGEGNPGWTLQEGFKDTEPATRNDDAAVGGCCDGEASAEDAAMGLPLLLLWRRRRYPPGDSAGSSRHRRLRATSSR